MGNHTWFFRPIKEGELIDDDYIEVFNGIEYTDIDTPHDLFRISSYRSDYLLSLEETLNFIENNKQLINYSCDNLNEELTQFWLDYPNGFISFG